MKKTKLTRSLLAACSIVALSAVMYGCVHGGGDDAPATDMSGTPDPAPDPAAPVDVTMDVALGADEQDALLDVLKASGDSDTLTVAAGGTATRAGVVFTCDSAYACTFTLDNNLGTIVASVTTQMLPDAADPTAMAAVPLPMDPLHPRYTLNASNAESVQGIIDVAIEVASDPGPPVVPAGARGNPSTTIGGLDIDGFGVYDMSKTTLTSDLDPNAGDHNPDAVSPAPAGGATLEVPRDLQMLHADKTALPGWAHSKVLFADWGDSKTPERDGGYETAALLYSDHEAPTSQPFDDKLAAKLANTEDRFTMTMVDFDGDEDTDMVNAVAVAATEDGADQRKGMMVTVEAPQLSTLNTTLVSGSRHKGIYFGGEATFRCMNDMCTVARAKTQDTAFTVTGGQWEILPDPGAMIEVPDQDYMVFGAWLTVPDDNVNGEHRMGVFYDGMREYAATDVERLTGKAKYEGGAAGAYSDSSDSDNPVSGMFTARAVLEADFGADNAAGMLSGRIDDFRNSAGVFLGSDTAANPNDPATGGENDWVVTLDSSAIAEGGVAVAADSISGSADGVEWDGGDWGARFYGASGTADDPVAPSGVAGQFRAMSEARGVVGAFGAMNDD